ncbi:MAG: hypothetical protein MJE68_24715 [Proteobacteria bacterium]|nr:hypothetical protein [Pseudomonadota bacterium]
MLIRLLTLLLVVAFASTTHAQNKSDPRISERMDTLLGESFDTAKNTIGLPDEQMQIGSTFIYTWVQQINAFAVCEIQLEVSSIIEAWEISGNEEACLEATENLETPELRAVHAKRVTDARRKAEEIERLREAEFERYKEKGNCRDWLKKLDRVRNRLENIWAWPTLTAESLEESYLSGVKKVKTYCPKQVWPSCIYGGDAESPLPLVSCKIDDLTQAIEKWARHP